MAFQRVYDMEQADKLWEAGLLWIRSVDDEDSDWLVDSSYGRLCAPSEESIIYEYAILLED